LGHFLKISDGQLCHFLELIYKLDPLFEFQDEVPRVGEIKHYYEGAVLEEGGLGELAVNGRGFSLLNHIDF